MEEDDINSVSEVEDLSGGFFQTTETFPEVSDSAPDRHVTAGVSMTKQLPNNIKPGSSGADERQDLPSSSRR